MTIREAMNAPLREILITWAMLLPLFQEYLCLTFFRLRYGRRIKAAVFFLYPLLFLLLFLLLDGVFHYGEMQCPRTWPAATTGFFSLPLSLLITLEVLFTALLIWESCMLIRIRKEHPTSWAVKETLDLLPAGVAFAEEDGRVVFANITMNEIARVLTGKAFMNLGPVLEKAEKTAGIQGPDTLQAVYPDGSEVWQFSSGRIMEDGKTYLRLVATDITELAKIHGTLQENHEKLKEIRRRLDIYSRTAERIIVSQELLNARMQVHNETGHILLASRHYMDQPGSVDETALLEMLKITNTHLLREYEEDDTVRDPLTEAIEMAKAIGVTVKLRGMIAEEGTHRTVLAAAIRECATNTRKHADGDDLDVMAEEEENQIEIRLTSKGNSTKSPNSESGGLASLRTLVENAGGSMEVFASETFLVKIAIPGEINGSCGWCMGGTLSGILLSERDVKNRRKT